MAVDINRSIEFDGRVLAEIDLGQCRELALGLIADGKEWHSHVLSPGCKLNPFQQSYAIIIEDDTDGTTYVAASDRFPEVDKELVKMLHGEDILDARKVETAGSGDPCNSTLLLLVRDLDKRHVAWHHHMHFPNCVFNPNPGNWSISVEFGESEVTDESYPEEPVDVLRELEVLYFRNLETRI